MNTHNMFLWRNIENYPKIIIKYPPFLVEGDDFGRGGRIVLSKPSWRSVEQIRRVFENIKFKDNFRQFSIKTR